MTPCIVVVEYHHSIGPCCLHIQCEVNGSGKGCIDLGRENKVVEAMWVSRKWGGIVTQAVGKDVSLLENNCILFMIYDA